jgi:hypothetical protein
LALDMDFLIRLLWNRIAWKLWTASTKEYSFEFTVFLFFKYRIKSLILINLYSTLTKGKSFNIYINSNYYLDQVLLS